MTLSKGSGRNIRWWRCVLPLLALAAGACDSDTATTGADASTSDAAAAAAGPALFNAPQTANKLTGFDALKDGWNEQQPGAPTVCSRGTKWAFYVYKGDPKKVVIDFEGGGACWNVTTCSVAGAIFNENIAIHLSGATQKIKTGIYDKERKDNPFHGWTHIYIPYCTGDVHWGDAKHTYGQGTTFDIHHRGGLNSRVALAWVRANLPGAENVFVTGCSAGAYGAAGWAPWLMKAYPDANVNQMGDCGAGVITDTFLQDSFPNWNAEQVMPSWIPDLDPAKVKITDLDFAELYIRMAKHNPDRTFSQFNTYYDWNQTFYFEAMGGGDAQAWNAKMTKAIDKIVKAAPNFRSFIGPGHEHCIIHRNAFYDVKANGVKLVDWVRAMTENKRPDSAQCVDCGKPKPK